MTKSMTTEEKLQVVMNNVMAALHAFGICYDTNTSGIGRTLEKPLEDLLKEESVVYTYDDYYDINCHCKFLKAMEAFLNKPHYAARMSARCWADDGDFVVVQLEKLYIMDESDLLEYAHWAGFSTIEDALYNYGDPVSTYAYFNVRIKKGGDISDFVRSYARRCWN